MKTTDFLKARESEIRQLTDTVKNDFLPLSNELLNMKPAPKKWSIAECFQHLNLTMDVYVTQMLEVVEKKDQFPPAENEFKLSFMGRMGVKAMQPKEGEKISYKMRTFKVLNPEASKVEGNPLDTFLEYQEGLLHIVASLEQMSLKKPKITTVVGPVFKMPIGDALHFMIAHNQRHILQAQKVLQIIH